MKERRLLERIAAYDVDGRRSHVTRVDVLIESILAHLTRILNTRQGSAPIDPEFGVPDFTNLAGTATAGTTQQIAVDIARVLQRYEPRLKAARVEQIESQDVLSLSYAIEGNLGVDGRDVHIRLTTRLSSDGHASVLRT